MYIMTEYRRQKSFSCKNLLYQFVPSSHYSALRLKAAARVRESALVEDAAGERRQTIAFTRSRHLEIWCLATFALSLCAVDEELKDGTATQPNKSGSHNNVLFQSATQLRRLSYSI